MIGMKQSDTVNDLNKVFYFLCLVLPSLIVLSLWQKILIVLKCFPESPSLFILQAPLLIHNT